MKNYRLHFIRHGLTEANKQGLYVGRTDYELCFEGIQELVRLKQEYEYPWVDTVYTSPLLRCVQTAGILYPDARLVPDQSLIELDFGDFEGKSYYELKDDPDYDRWLQDSMSTAPRNGESGDVFVDRIIGACSQIFEDMMQQELTDVAVVTHGGVIMTLMAALGLPKRNMREWAIGNGRGYTVLMTPQMWMRDRAFEVAGLMPHGATAQFGESISMVLGEQD